MRAKVKIDTFAILIIALNKSIETSYIGH